MFVHITLTFRHSYLVNEKFYENVISSMFENYGLYLLNKTLVKPVYK